MRFYIRDRRPFSRWRHRLKDICLSRVGYYHVDEQYKFHLAEKDCFAKLKERRDIQLPLDLNEGFYELRSEWIDKIPLPSSIGYMMQWIRAAKHDLKGVDVIMNTNLVMGTIGKTLFDKYKKKWGFKLFMINGMIYITKNQIPTAQRLKQNFL